MTLASRHYQVIGMKWVDLLEVMTPRGVHQENLRMSVCHFFCLRELLLSVPPEVIGTLMYGV